MATEIVEVPEWGGSVKVKALTGSERDKYESDSLTGRGRNRDINLANIRARLVALTVIDDNGKPLFSSIDIAALGGKSAKALDRIFDVAQRLSGISEEDIEELAKNSESGQSDASTSS